MRRVLSDGSSWPEPRADLEWTLRYGNPTREQLLSAAGVVSAYESLVYDSTRSKRDLVCREMRYSSEAPEPLGEVTP
jgi:hypothetical protein